jgi:hypothetical protein
VTEELKTEADFAFAYAEERKMRLALEDRINAMLYELVPFSAGALNLVEAVINRDTSMIFESIKLITRWRSDVEINMMLNLIKPAGTVNLLDESILHKINGLGDIPERDIDHIKDVLFASAKKIYEEWDALSEDYADIATCEEAREISVKALHEMVSQTKKNA